MTILKLKSRENQKKRKILRKLGGRNIFFPFSHFAATGQAKKSDRVNFSYQPLIFSMFQHLNLLSHTGHPTEQK
jgi:hypothetical protein